MRRHIEIFGNGILHYNFDNGLTVRAQITWVNEGQRISCNTYRRNSSDKFVAEIKLDECENLTADALVDHLYEVSRRKIKSKVTFGRSYLVSHGITT